MRYLLECIFCTNYLNLIASFKHLHLVLSTVWYYETTCVTNYHARYILIQQLSLLTCCSLFLSDQYSHNWSFYLVLDSWLIIAVISLVSGWYMSVSDAEVELRLTTSWKSYHLPFYDYVYPSSMNITTTQVIYFIFWTCPLLSHLVGVVTWESFKIIARRDLNHAL